MICSNNTNKLSPQEPVRINSTFKIVQIIQINLALKNLAPVYVKGGKVQIIQINLALKNVILSEKKQHSVQIIQINLALKNFASVHVKGGKFK